MTTDCRQFDALRAPRAPRVLAAGVAIVGIVGALSALTPELRARLEAVHWLIPPVASGAARVLALAVSIALVSLAAGLRRRKRAAWQMTAGGLVLSAVLHLAKGLDVEEATLSVALLAALLAYRRDFDVEADPETPRRFARHAAAVVAGGVVLGMVVIEAQSALAHDALRPLEALRETAYDSVGIESDRLSGRGGDAVPWVIALYAIGGFAYLSYLWQRPRAQYVRRVEADRRDAHRLVTSCGDDSLAYFALRLDKSYHFNEARTAFLAYRVSAGVALVSGDPIGDDDAFDDLLTTFSAYCHRHGWRIAVIGVGESRRPLWERFGLLTLYIGDEAVVEPATFTLEGRAIRKVRQSVTRLRKAGYTIRILRREQIDRTLRAELDRVSREYLGGQPDRGFSMALDDLFSPEHDDCIFACAIGPGGVAEGFVHLVPTAHARGLSLSAMRRLRETPNGLTEFMLCELFAWGKAHDIAQVSLNFNAFGEILRSEPDGLPPWQRGLRWFLGRADQVFQIERLLSFNRKFLPSWQPRYAAFERVGDLPLAAMVLLAAESFIELPRPLRRPQLREPTAPRSVGGASPTRL